jgi:TMEM175 potassium channel family protein
VEKARLEAFSDGVFAVAITLLALDLAVPGPGPDNGSLAFQLGTRWPTYAAYVLSFFVIGIMWVNHHALFESFARTDRTLLFLNLTLLLFVVAVPFGTSTVAEYLREGGSDAHLAAALYAAIFLGAAVSFNAIFAWSLRDGNRHTPLPPGTERAALLRFGVGGFVYLAALVVAFINAAAAVALIAGIAIYYVFERTSG